MSFTIAKSIEILDRTPGALTAMLKGVSDEWALTNEGGETWSPYDVLGHLIHGEHTDWIERLDIILSDKPDKTFRPFDRFAQFNESKGKSLDALLEEFSILRKRNIAYLRAKNLSGNDLEKKGIHPVFGEVSLTNLLATWVVHDLDHTSQIARVMAGQYKNATGPWVEYLRILK
jgi:hypothetical protein